MARNRGLSVECEQVDVSSELNLPPTWDAYLGGLNGKQRHEIRRKLRRLREAAAVSYRSISGIDEIREFVDIFFDLFTQSRDDKAAFLTPQMRLFFSDLINDLFPLGLLKLNVLEMDDRPAAMVICFDYGDTIYLYNNGFDIRYRNLSVGTLCKAFSIQESIELGKKKYDFLKGAEVYKQRMGGSEVPLYRCRVRIS
jgi:CelD/BcsL family acetyltransferase involved in cellulose biosynthesis